MTPRLHLGRVVALLIASAALLAGIAVALSGAEFLPSYLAAWLFLLAAPVGALPVVMGIELVGRGRSLAVLPIRRMLLLLPPSALFAVPVLLRMNSIHRWTTSPQSAFSAAWFHTDGLTARMVVYLLIWSLLALIFSRPPPKHHADGRPGLAIVGLLAHFLVATMAAVDWVMSVDLKLASSEFGLMLISAQCGTAIGCALLTMDRRSITAPYTSSLILLLVIASASWAYMQFMQFLAIWSANEPEQAIWYLHRSSGLGQAAEWLGFFSILAILLLLLPLRFLSAAVLWGVAALVVVTHLFEMFWLITPSFRDHFTVTGTDGICIAVAGTVLGAFLYAFRPPPTRDIHEAS